MTVRPIRLSDLPLLERMAVICACGECGIDPATWECESSRDPEAIEAARRTLRKIGHPAGGLPVHFVPKPKTDGEPDCPICQTLKKGPA